MMADKKEKVGFFGSIKNFFKGIGQYCREIKAEMKKIVWPTKSQIINNTLIVIAVTLVAAVFIYGLDTSLGLVVKLIYQNV
ncbi:MAG: preprotein translocase subunit SecE [Oscillospiraceae bacterium]